MEVVFNNRIGMEQSLLAMSTEVVLWIFFDRGGAASYQGGCRRRAQIRALARMGVGYLVRPDGRPIVTRQSLEMSVSGSGIDRSA